MSNSNVLIYISDKHHVRIHFIDSTNIVQNLKVIHSMNKTSLAALGRVSTMAAIMSCELKNDNEKSTIIINGKGPIGQINVCYNSNGDIKAYVTNPNLYLVKQNGKLDVSKAVGTDGDIKVIKDLMMLKNYCSSTKIQTGEIGDDFAYYFATSEQRPSIVSLGVLVDQEKNCIASGGLFIELIPGYCEEDITYLENLVKNIDPISTTILKKVDPTLYLKEFFEDIKLLGSKKVQLKCDCSKIRFLYNLSTLNKNDINDLFDNDSLSLHCRFCNTTYKYSKDEVLEFLKNV